MRPTSEAPGNSPPACIDEVEPNAIPVAPVFGILFALSFAHLVNDTLQSLIPAIYPILKAELRLDYSHIGLITLTNQLTASLLNRSSARSPTNILSRSRSRSEWLQRSSVWSCFR